jgi:DNA-binding GntR family transcriptional regulator
MKALAAGDFELRMQAKEAQMKTHQWVYQLLRTNLLCGRIGPGHALTIRGLAQMLDVSPMPIREALHRLACEGAVEVKDNRRVIVPNMTAEKFNELCQLRVLLETHAAVSALPHINSGDIDKLENIDAQIDIAVEAGEVEEISLINQDFHRTLYELNPFQKSVALIESLWLQLGPFSRIVISKLEKAYLVDRHVEAIDALKNKDFDGLRLAIKADIHDGIASMKSIDEFQTYFESVA